MEGKVIEGGLHTQGAGGLWEQAPQSSKYQIFDQTCGVKKGFWFFGSVHDGTAARTVGLCVA